MQKLKKIYLVMMILFLYFFISSLFNNSHAIEYTDIGNINDSFLFAENNSYQDMKFSGVPSNDSDNFWNKLYEKYKIIIVLVSGVLSIAFIGLFIINITKYGASATNPQARSQAVKTLLWTGVAAGLFGIVTVITSISYFLFK